MTSAGSGSPARFFAALRMTRGAPPRAVATARAGVAELGDLCPDVTLSAAVTLREAKGLTVPFLSTLLGETGKYLV